MSTSALVLIASSSHVRLVLSPLGAPTCVTYPSFPHGPEGRGERSRIEVRECYRGPVGHPVLAEREAMEGASMGTVVTVDIFLSVDGWAGSEGLPGYFGYLGPELEEWITTELAAPQIVVMGRRTYEALAGLPDETHGES